MLPIFLILLGRVRRCSLSMLQQSFNPLTSICFSSPSMTKIVANILQTKIFGQSKAVLLSESQIIADLIYLPLSFKIIINMLSSFRVGCATFKGQAPQKLRKDLFNPDVVAILKERKQWWLCLGEYKYQNWEAMFALMEECEVNKIELGRNLNNRLIAQVKGVKYSCLQAMCFGSNRIESLQLIQHINAPHIRWLSFEQNYITSLRSLRKANFPKLQTLNLKSNRIREIQLNQLKASKLSKLCIQFFHTDYHQNDSLRWVFKLQTSQLQIMRCRSEKRIKQTHLNKLIKQCHPSIAFKQFDVERIDEEENSDSDH